jgi:exodeoxyribonuclease V gamma subunit
MPLAIRYVRSLADVIQPAVDFLSRPVDLFERQRVVVPTAGAKAWLAAELARRLGSRDPARGDGILANVEFSYPGTISSLLAPEGMPVPDPWNVDHLTFAILQAITDNPSYAAIVTRAGGPLLAARRIADRFDHYHFRRPGMILEWEKGEGVFSPSADDHGHVHREPLGKRDRWQFDLWRAVRDSIGMPSPPARERNAKGPGPDAVLVAGLQGLSLHQITLLEKLAGLPGPSGKPCDVQAVLVHPSPRLREAWAKESPAVTPDVAPARRETVHEDDVDPLVDAWLRGTREAQWLLASQRIEPVHADDAILTPLPDGASLLARLKHAVATGDLIAKGSTTPAFNLADASVRIHRCHDLSRQAEVLHDAILHAFREIDGLAPHDVVIVSPQIADLAPHLAATFDRTIERDDGPIHLPLLVADRGIREVSEGAELLAAIIEVVGSRCSVEGLLAVAEHALVMAAFQIDDDGSDTWRRCIDRTKIRWGLDADRRVRSGLDQPELQAHTWKRGLERMLLGATIPDGPPEPVLGDVVPLAGIDAADIEPLSKLISIVAVIDDLDRAVVEPRPVGQWCDLLEATLERLAGDETDEVAIPLRALDDLRQAALTAPNDAGNVPVPWHDLRSILGATLTAPVGRQPLRTGAITATSMIPLRGVPFRVVCVAGLDEQALAPRESDSEDLVERQQLMGDLDARLEVRRSLLDCLLAAGDRLIITCTGMDVRNNSIVPLVTPLAEFVDFATRHGVPLVPRHDEQHAAIEVFHPRHACSRRNFLTGSDGVVVGDEAWSHDTAARAAAAALGKDSEREQLVVDESRKPTHIDLHELAQFMHDPLWPYVRKTLAINTWRDDDMTIPATLPLELETLERRNLRSDFLDRLIETDDAAALERAWSAAVTANGDIPVGGYGGDVIQEITQFARSLLEVATASGVPLHDGRPEAIHLDLDGITLSGPIERWYAESGMVVLVRPDAMASDSRQFLIARNIATLCLLAQVASGSGATKALVLNQHKDWSPGHRDDTPAPAQVRTIWLAGDIDRNRARAILQSLCTLYQQAAIRPYGAFGKTATELGQDREAAREAFASFTSGSDFATSLEVVVHGTQADFDDVFPEEPGIVDFFSRLKALVAFGRPFYTYTPS